MDNIERLECVFYSGPLPGDISALTAMCLVFDKVHFPNVYLPRGGYDTDSLNREISRLEGLSPQDHDTAVLIGLLKYLDYWKPLEGIFVYPSAAGSIFGGKDDQRGKLMRMIYDANYAPRTNFEPHFNSASVKGLPESEESLEYAPTFAYHAGAIIYASQMQLPLLDDGSGLQLPFRAQYKDNAQSLSAMIALEAAALTLPDLPLLTPREIVEFRMENTKELHAYRSAMLRYANVLNSRLDENATDEDVAKKIGFLVETEIKPALHDLNRDLVNPNRPWYKRMSDVGKIAASVTMGVMTAGLAGQTVAQGLTNIALAELEGRGGKIDTAKRNGLYYLLRARTIRS
jgi:hypothetical protein